MLRRWIFSWSGVFMEGNHRTSGGRVAGVVVGASLLLAVLAVTLALTLIPHTMFKQMMIDGCLSLGFSPAWLLNNNWIVRKVGHFAAYLIIAAFTLRLSRWPGWRLVVGVAALAVAAEAAQFLSPGRGPSVLDAALGSAGAALAWLVVPRPPAEETAGEPHVVRLPSARPTSRPTRRKAA